MIAKRIPGFYRVTHGSGRPLVVPWVNSTTLRESTNETGTDAGQHPTARGSACAFVAGAGNDVLEFFRLSWLPIPR